MAKSSWGSKGIVSNSNIIHMTNHAAKVFKGKYAKPYDVYLDPIPCRTLDDMGQDEIAALEKQYGCPIAKRVF